jgi:hypothetical protein
LKKLAIFVDVKPTSKRIHWPTRLAVDVGRLLPEHGNTRFQSLRGNTQQGGVSRDNFKSFVRLRQQSSKAYRAISLRRKSCPDL